MNSRILMTGFCIIILLLLGGCDRKDSQNRRWQGLIGAYYGDPDFTNIKESEILHTLNNEWNDETGHGSAWSGKWEGFLIAPISGPVTLNLESNKPAELYLEGTHQIKLGAGETDAFLELNMVEKKSYHIELTFAYEKGEPGFLKLFWDWQSGNKSIIPSENIYFDSTQALRWNWLPEPDPMTIDLTKFTTVATRNVIVYYEPGRFGGWPANNGIWIWGDEISVGFIRAYYQKQEWHHSIDGTKPAQSVLARSLDGGESWMIEDPDNFVGDGNESVICDGNIQFNHPDFALRCDKDRFFISYDRGKSWQGPYIFPDFGTDKLTARTDYIINNAQECLFFLSSEEKKVQARLQDRAFCAKTKDGGKTFQFLSWIVQPVTYRSVMPSTVRIADKHLVTALRRRYDEQFPDRPHLARNWIDVYESRDDGQSWQFLNKVADTDMAKHNGNPPSLVRLNDGRLCVTYGYRAVPYGIRAKLSSNNGKSWSDEIHLRDDAITWDIGYTRSVQRLDGKIVTIYYYSTEEHEEQHIAATIWDPNIIKSSK